MDHILLHILLSYMTEFRADLERLSLKTIKKKKLAVYSMT